MRGRHYDFNTKKGQVLPGDHAIVESGFMHRT